MILRIKLFFSWIFYCPIWILFIFSKNKKLIESDIQIWQQYSKPFSNIISGLIYLLKFHPPFRNLVYYRLPNFPNIIKKIICPPYPTLTINPQIKGFINDIEGGGLYLIHPFGTIITAKKIGKNCIVRQLTTIGSKSTDKALELPTIGDNVDFGCNVCCIGNITIGNNVIIGAGAVVVKDVPDNAIIAGNPAKIIGWKKFD